MSLAIHAGLNAADAVTGVRLGVRAAGQDHYEAIGPRRTAGPDGVAAAKELGRLLPMKARAGASDGGLVGKRERVLDAVTDGNASKGLR